MTELKEWHPKYTTLRLRWTLSGRWVKAPVIRDLNGDNFYTYRVARIEKYVDKYGTMREALSYGDKDTHLMVWYDLGEIRTAFSSWKVPEESQWVNTREWNPEFRIVPGGSETGGPRGGPRGSRGNPCGNPRGNPR